MKGGRSNEKSACYLLTTCNYWRYIILGCRSGGLKYTGTGWWSYGTTGLFGGGTVYSDLSDAVFQHSTSVVNANGKWGYSGTKNAGIKAKATQTAYNFRTDEAYYKILDPFS